ncbi:MAG: four helix bundle protein [Balneolaceae bacterium]|nr:four helix bundle protein [Balneolaceae bacterium]
MAIYNLEERTLDFAKRVRNFVKQTPKNVITIEDTKQLIRSSGSVGANYIEANEAVSKKDFAFRIKIARKEAKESRYWLNLIDDNSSLELNNERLALIDEATQLLKIFSSILVKST